MNSEDVRNHFSHLSHVLEYICNGGRVLNLEPQNASESVRTFLALLLGCFQLERRSWNVAGDGWSTFDWRVAAISYICLQLCIVSLESFFVFGKAAQ